MHEAVDHGHHATGVGKAHIGFRFGTRPMACDQMPEVIRLRTMSYRRLARSRPSPALVRISSRQPANAGRPQTRHSSRASSRCHRWGGPSFSSLTIPLLSICQNTLPGGLFGTSFAAHLSSLPANILSVSQPESQSVWGLLRVFLFVRAAESRKFKRNIRDIVLAYLSRTRE